MPRRRKRKPKTTGEPRKHHFVPRGYLKQWCADGETLHRFRRKEGVLVHDRVSARETAFAQDLYRIAEPYRNSFTINTVLLILTSRFGKAFADFNFERTLMDEIDRRGIEAQRKFLARPIKGAGDLDQKILWDLLRFLYLLTARNTYTLEYMQEATMRRLEGLVEAHGLTDSPLLNLDDLRKDLNSAKMTVIEAVFNEEEFRRRFDGIGCVPIAIDREQKTFVISNCPYPTQGKQTFQVAPLSPDRALILSGDIQLLEGIQRGSNANMVDAMNFLSIGLAHEVYALDEREADEIDRHMGLFHSDLDRFNAVAREKIRAAAGH